MTRPRLAPALLVPLAASLVGCAASRSVSVELKNDAARPVTVWLTQAGGHATDEDWMSPEDLAAATTGARLPRAINGVVVPPGKTASVGPVKGRFGADTFPELRVYAGQLTFEQILATPADGKLRVDVPLEFGANRLHVAPGDTLAVARQ